VVSHSHSRSPEGSSGKVSSLRSPPAQSFPTPHRRPEAHLWTGTL